MLLPISVSHQGMPIGYCQQLTDNCKRDTSISLGEIEGDRQEGRERERKGEGGREREGDGRRARGRERERKKEGEGGRYAADTLRGVMVPGWANREACKRQTCVQRSGSQWRHQDVLSAELCSLEMHMLKP